MLFSAIKTPSQPLQQYHLLIHFTLVNTKRFLQVFNFIARSGCVMQARKPESHKGILKSLWTIHILSLNDLNFWLTASFFYSVAIYSHSARKLRTYCLKIKILCSYDIFSNILQGRYQIIKAISGRSQVNICFLKQKWRRYTHHPRGYCSRVYRELKKIKV